MSAEEIIDDYMSNIGPFEEPITKDDIENYLKDCGIEYDDLDELYSYAKECQEGIDFEGKRDLLDNLSTDLEYYIEDYENSDQLTGDDVGKILIKLADSYFGSY